MSAQDGRPKGAVFIDGAYLALATNEKGAPRLFEIDIEKMSNELLGPYARLRTYFYNVLPQDPEYAKVVEQYHTNLGLGDRIEVRLGKLQRTPKGMKDRQKQVGCPSHPRHVQAGCVREDRPSRIGQWGW